MRKTPPHPKRIQLLFSILEDVLQHDHFLDRSIGIVFKNHKTLNAADREFIAFTAYELIRNWRLLQESSGYSNEYIFKHPFAFLPAYYLYTHAELPEELKHMNFNKWEFNKKLEPFLTERKYKYSYPDELDAYCSNDLGEEKWNSLAAALHQKAPRYIRVNTLKTTKGKLKELLAASKVQLKDVDGAPAAFEVLSSKPLFDLPAFLEGLFELQDVASQRVSEFLAPQPGEKVIDACAGTGGKSLHPACLTQNKGKVVAMDIAENKLEQLKKRAARANVQNIETRTIEAEKTIKRYVDFADKLLLDVPCSGTGVFKRNPDAKWNITPASIHSLVETQKEILRHYSAMCKVGGIMVYANCSILPSEGERQMEEFVKTNRSWELLQEQRTHPDTEQVDGFYMAKLKRKI